MTPEERVKQYYWWVLSKLKENLLITLEGQPVPYRLSHVFAAGIPGQETEKNILAKLEEIGALKIRDNPWKPPVGSNDLFYVDILQPKFDEIYKIYKSLFDPNHQDSEDKESFFEFIKHKKDSTPSNNKEENKPVDQRSPIIRSKTLELIALHIGDLDTGPGLVRFLLECGVAKNLIEYPQTKWRMVYSVLINYSTSSKPQDQEVLFKVIEEAGHPMMYSGNAESAKQYEDKLNNWLKYDGLVLKDGKLQKGDEIATNKDIKEEVVDYQEDESGFGSGISSNYEGSDLELFILKKILVQHKERDDAGFIAKELSFKNDSLKNICVVINRLIEDGILFLSANTRPEASEDGKVQGIEDKDDLINWSLVERLDKDPQSMDSEDGTVIFDVDVTDEVKLKGRIDLSVEEFMNDKEYNDLGYLVDLGANSYTYKKQREIVLKEIIQNEDGELAISLTGFKDPRVDVLKTILALEKENVLRIKDLNSVPIFDQKGSFVGKWSKKDNPTARIQILKTQPSKQEPIPIRIVNDVGIRGFEEKVVLQKPTKRRLQLQKFPKNTKWTDITVRFLNDQEVIINVKDYTFQTTYQAMGFEDEKTKIPNKQWKFLQLLAIKNGELNWENNKNLPLKQINSIKKQKQLLADALKAYFQIDEDPFFDYRTEKSYRIKITLIPQADSKSTTEDGDIDPEIDEYLKEESPEVYDQYDR